jgi:hypothetical protein
MRRLLLRPRHAVKKNITSVTPPICKSCMHKCPVTIAPPKLQVTLNAPSFFPQHPPARQTHRFRYVSRYDLKPASFILNDTKLSRVGRCVAADDKISAVLCIGAAGFKPLIHSSVFNIARTIKLLSKTSVASRERHKGKIRKVQRGDEIKATLSNEKMIVSLQHISKTFQ